METKFTFSLYDLMRLSVNQGEAMTIAEQAANEMVAFANDMLSRINEYSNLHKAMTNTAGTEIADCLVAIKHVSVGLAKLRNQYLNSDLIDHFDPANHKVFKILEKATTAATPLLDLLK